MSYNLIATRYFDRRLKRLAKKHKSLQDDLLLIGNELKENPTLGTPIGKECYKIRVAIKSKGKGKSGGARLITYVRVVGERVFLLDIYDKSEQESISEKDLLSFIEEIEE